MRLRGTLCSFQFPAESFRVSHHFIFHLVLGPQSSHPTCRTFSQLFVFRASGALGSMFTNLINEVPLVWKPFVFAFFCILILVVLLLVAGYRLKLPFWIELSPAPVANTANNTQALEQEIKDLRKMLGNLALNPGTEVTSSVEEIKPLGYDCQTGSHSSQVPSLPPPQPLTPSKRRNRDIILTPVKARVLSQPDFFPKPSTLHAYSG